MTYAAGTSVGEDRSRAELQWLLEKFGADRFGFQVDNAAHLAKITFMYKEAYFLFRLPLARPEDKQVKFTPGGKARCMNQISQLLACENRRRWRSLCLAIKAMLVGVEDGIFNFGEVFMPYMIWGDGRTTAETLLPVAEDCLKSGGMLPPLSNPARLLEAHHE